ncbi:hypothetical protein CGRA01v4_00420 [Colletotrichum graminicola]|nr:hypothetical protein CGRA01v4_00420 [Colletotrichum graminicola]
MPGADWIRSKTALTKPVGMIQSPGGPSHRTTSKRDAPTLQIFTFLEMIKVILFLCTNMLLLPLFGWNVASITVFIFLRCLPFGRQIEGALRLSYNIAVMEMGGSKTLTGFGKPKE